MPRRCHLQQHGRPVVKQLRQQSIYRVIAPACERPVCKPCCVRRSNKRTRTAIIQHLCKLTHVPASCRSFQNHCLLAGSLAYSRAGCFVLAILPVVADYNAWHALIHAYKRLRTCSSACNHALLDSGRAWPHDSGVSTAVESDSRRSCPASGTRAGRYRC